MLRFALVSVLLFFMSMQGFSQKSIGGLPPGKQFKLKKSISYISIHLSHSDSVQISQASVSRTKALRFAQVISVNINIDSTGTWETLPDGNLLWRAGIESSGAYSLSFYFSKYHLPEGAQLYIYSPDNDQVLGAFTTSNNNSTGDMTTSILPGDKAIIECIVPKQQVALVRLQLSQVGHDYYNIVSTLGLKDGNYGRAGSCNVDIICTEAALWQQEKYAVVRLLIDNSVLCTGTLINNTSNNGKPYIITANHCISSNSEAKRTVALFDYESPTCGGVDGSALKTLSGASLVSTIDKIDYSLILMNDTPTVEYHPYYAGWTLDTVSPTAVACIHHPEGDVKKFSYSLEPVFSGDFCSPQTVDCVYDLASHWQVSEWDIGTTEGGSSGSPLFNQQHLFIGDLTGGDAYCGKSVNDFFTKFYRAWADYPQSKNRLEPWLDPNSTGRTWMWGYDPYASLHGVCDTLCHIGNTENVRLYKSNSGSGYLSGNNSLGYNAMAEEFETGVASKLYGMLINVAKAYSAYSDAAVTFKIWDATLYPPYTVYAKSYKMKEIQAGAINLVYFDSLVPVSTHFLLGYELSKSKSDTFAVYQAEDRGIDGENEILLRNADGWQKLSDLTSVYSSLDIRPILCSDSTLQVQYNDNITEFTVFPNPARNKVNVRLLTDNQTSIDIKLYDLTGRLLQAKITDEGNNTYSIDVSALSRGVYFVKLNNGTSSHTKKILLY